MTTESKRISAFEVAIFIILSAQPDHWFTNSEVEQQVGDNMSRRSIHQHTARFAKLRLIDRTETFPEHRFRWSANAGKRNGTYLHRLREAAVMFGAVKSAA